MRIGIDCRSLQEVEPSGVSWYAYSIIDQLTQQYPEHEYVLTTVGTRTHHAAPLLTLAQEAWKDRSVIWNALRFHQQWLTLGTLGGVVRSWERLFTACDVLWLPNLHFFPHTRPSMPTVLTIHDLSFERYPQYLPIKGRVWHKVIRPKKLLQSMDAVVCVSKHTQDELARVYTDVQTQSVVVYPGVENRDGMSEIGSGYRVGGIESAAKPAHQEHRPFTLCTISTIEPRKNIDIIAQMYVRLRHVYPNLRCVVVGKPGYQSRKIIRALMRVGVEYTGYLSQYEKQNLLKQSDIMIYPSIYEGFGLPPLEAQALGIPVIAGAHTSLPEVFGESALLCDMNDIGALCTTVEALMNTPNLREYYRVLGLRNAQRFLWNQTAHGLMQVLSKSYQQH